MRALAALLLILAAPAAPAAERISHNGSGTGGLPPAARIFARARASSQEIWERLAYLCDAFGPRLAGSTNLDGALHWAADSLRRDGFAVRLEPVKVPVWVRGEESAELLAPARRPLALLGLGGTVGTPPGGIEADVLVVRSFEDLEAKKARAKGKVVLFDVPYTDYGATGRYRWDGPSAAARAGAVACLIRSVASASLRTPHTGSTEYAADAPRIPSAALSVEDSAMLGRWAERGETPRVKLVLGAKELPEADSANLVADFPGREKPGEIVLISGHADSWDVGAGAHDDGAGVVAAWEALRILKALNLRPRRTVRLVLWTNEENGTRGAKAYAKEHAAELPRHAAAIEFDSGGYAPRGFSVAASTAAFARVKALATELQPFGAGTISDGSHGTDIKPLAAAGVPGLSLDTADERYFDYHHSPADTPDKVAPRDLADDAAALAAMAYALADAR